MVVAFIRRLWPVLRKEARPSATAMLLLNLLTNHLETVKANYLETVKANRHLKSDGTGPRQQVVQGEDVSFVHTGITLHHLLILCGRPGVENFVYFVCPDG